MRFHRLRHPSAMGAPEVSTFLSHLATELHVSASTQNQALSAMLFLYRDVLQRDLPWLDDLVRAKRPERLPTVLTADEVRALLAALDGTPRLVAALLYGSGLRLLEGLQLRVKDLDFGRREPLVRDGKGQRDRRSLLPQRLLQPLQAHLGRVKHLHDSDLRRGWGSVELPGALAIKYPAAACEWGWQWVFPATRPYPAPRTCELRRHHLHESVIQRAVKEARRRAGIAKPAGCHTLRHSFPTDLLERGHDIRTIQELVGHKEVTTTMIYTHVLNRGGLGVQSPLDRCLARPPRMR